MRERCQVAAGAYRSARRDSRMNAMIEQCDQRFERGQPDAGTPARQDVGAQGHHRADLRHRQGFIHASRVASQEIDLQRSQLIGRNGHFRQGAESGVDAVHRFGTCRMRVHHRARSIHAGDRCRRESYLDAVGCDTLQIIKSE